MGRKPPEAGRARGRQQGSHLRRRPGRMNVLLDTNILARMAQPGTPACQLAHDATDALGRRGDTLYLVPQVLQELWVVATRPVAANGLGLTPAQADHRLPRA